MNIKEYIASGIIETYVMGLCTKEEEQELESLRSAHPELNDAIILYETELEKKMLQNQSMPSSSVDDSILRMIDNFGTPVLLVQKQSSTKTLKWMKIAVAASIILFVISAGLNLTLYNKTSQLKKQVSELNSTPTLPAADYEIMTNPTITPVAMYGVGIHSICRCTMYWDKKTGKAYIMIHHLIRSTESQNYQLWAMVDGKPVSVGIINDEIRGRFITMENVPASATAFSVTLEKAGGNLTPTMSQEYLHGSI
ncbi:MAG TPA: anti-sigma factor [Chitinophagaceae bacterium]|nr:anti-sigma factor [Chitinophagaceae bacterium]